MTSSDLLGSFLTSRESSNLFEVIKNYKHGRMMPILAFWQFFSEIREMTLNDLRGQKKNCLTSDSERSINTLSTLQVTSYNSERGDPYPAAPGMLRITEDRFRSFQNNFGRFLTISMPGAAGYGSPLSELKDVTCREY